MRTILFDGKRTKALFFGKWVLVLFPFFIGRTS